MVSEIDFSVRNYSSRTELRKMVVLKFLEELPGKGGGDAASRYRYNVETLGDGRKVYLTRPAYLKKGFDFRINVEHTAFQTGHEYPKHDDIFNDLRQKRLVNPLICKRLCEAIERVHACEDPEDILPDYKDIKFNEGHSVELILKVIKWFLIEQDVRDWNYSGRQIFIDGVNEILIK